MVVDGEKACYDLKFTGKAKKPFREKLRVSLVEFLSVFGLLLEEKR